jgi:hypothetical protein
VPRCCGKAKGEYCLVGRARFNGKEVERSVLHAIGLNEIQLIVLRAGVLVRWVGSVEIRSQNELTGFGFAKDYDAVVTVRSGAEELRFRRYLAGVTTVVDMSDW